MIDRIEVTVECPTCNGSGSAANPRVTCEGQCQGGGTITAALTGRDALVYEAGQSTLEMLWIAGYRHDSPDFEVRSQKFRLTDDEREWLRLKAADAALLAAYQVADKGHDAAEEALEQFDRADLSIRIAAITGTGVS